MKTRGISIAMSALLLAACGSGESNDAAGSGGNPGSGSQAGSTSGEGMAESGGARGSETVEAVGGTSAPGGASNAGVSGQAGATGTGPAGEAGSGGIGGAGDGGRASNGGGGGESPASGDAGNETELGGSAGTCSAGAAGDCAAVDVAEGRVDVVLLIDMSGSSKIIPVGSAVSLWDLITASLGPSLADAPEALHFGMGLFPQGGIDPQCSPAECCQVLGDAGLEVSVSADSGSRTEIPALVSPIEPAGGSPLAAKLEQLGRYLVANANAMASTRFVVAIVGNGPNCNPNAVCERDECTMNMNGACESTTDLDTNCCELEPEGCLDTATGVQQVEALAAMGVRTAIVGRPTHEAYVAPLNALALAGGLASPNGRTDYYSPGNADEDPSALARTLTELFQRLALE